jgi:hypothetical protein
MSNKYLTKISSSLNGFQAPVTATEAMEALKYMNKPVMGYTYPELVHAHKNMGRFRDKEGYDEYEDIYQTAVHDFETALPASRAEALRVVAEREGKITRLPTSRDAAIAGTLAFSGVGAGIGAGSLLLDKAIGAPRIPLAGKVLRVAAPAVALSAVGALAGAATPSLKSRAINNYADVSELYLKALQVREAMQKRDAAFLQELTQEKIAQIRGPYSYSDEATKGARAGSVAGLLFGAGVMAKDIGFRKVRPRHLPSMLTLGAAAAPIVAGAGAVVGAARAGVGNAYLSILRAKQEKDAAAAAGL